jgi:hypothetical protein
MKSLPSIILEGLKKLFNDDTSRDLAKHSGFVYDNEELFFRNFLKLNPELNEIMEIYFNTGYIKVSWMHISSGTTLSNTLPLGQFYRWLRSENIGVQPNVTAAMVKELREKTDETMMNCKKALTACGGNMVDAEEYLKTNKHRFCGLVTYDRRG